MPASVPWDDGQVLLVVGQMNPLPRVWKEAYICVFWMSMGLYMLCNSDTFVNMVHIQSLAFICWGKGIKAWRCQTSDMQTGLFPELVDVFLLVGDIQKEGSKPRRLNQLFCLIDPVDASEGHHQLATSQNRGSGGRTGVNQRAAKIMSSTDSRMSGGHF